ncbi:TIGR02391 family protein [Streptomyces sp. SID13726]|nr:TIGR02391 family protein [Streptomyces sp. SID13726]NEB04836.1 TIGR02391 family protein [Streptomyces sp. SID13726]
MRQRLEEFDELAAKYRASIPRDGKRSGDATLRGELRTAEPTLKKILTCLDPLLATFIDVDRLEGVVRAQASIKRGLGILNDMDDWATRLAPDAPSLPADQFHPWVWDAARTLWESEHYRAAVHAAATSINAHLQTKLGRRDLSDAKLVQEAFSDKAPETGKPRLRIPGDQTDPGVQTRQRGALQLGQGAYFALRNPAAHETGDLAEQEAMEQLATFSVVARLIDQCQVVA